MGTHETLGLMLVKEGAISRPQLYAGMRQQRQTGKLIGDCLVSLGFISPQQLLTTLSRQLAMPALPPGAISEASPAAAALLPGHRARALGVVPFSWDGTVLVLAVPHCKSLTQLAREPDLASHELKAYLALESDIALAQARLYPAQDAAVAQSPLFNSPSRPRPLQTGTDKTLQLQEGPDETNQGRSAQTTVLTKVKSSASTASLPQGQADDPIPVELPQKPFLDSIEKLYEKQAVNDIARAAGQGLSPFFSRVAVGRFSAKALHILGYCGWVPTEITLPYPRIPAICASATNRAIAYGTPQDDRRIQEVVQAFGSKQAPAALVALVGARSGAPLLFYGDNGADPRIYDDLHDIELLLKEVETAIVMLNV